MPRRPRTHLDAMPLHIVQRGHNRDASFFFDDYYLAYLRLENEPGPFDPSRSSLKP